MNWQNRENDGVYLFFLTPGRLEISLEGQKENKFKIIKVR